MNEKPLISRLCQAQFKVNDVVEDLFDNINAILKTITVLDVAISQAEAERLEHYELYLARKLRLRTVLNLKHAATSINRVVSTVPPCEELGDPVPSQPPRVEREPAADSPASLEIARGIAGRRFSRRPRPRRRPRPAGADQTQA